jgi:predicted  nucleic acid-binding Zn-ribbon protein
MSVIASALRELHHIHRQLTELTSRRDRGPAQIKAGEANHEKLQHKLEQAKEQLTRLKVRSDDRQLQLQEREDRINDWKAKLNTCGSNREYQALKEQIAADEQANNVLMGEILEALEELDQRQETIDQLAQETATSHTKLEELRQRVEHEGPQLQAELDQVHERLKVAESKLPEDIRIDYFRIAKARGEEALAPIDGETCGSCYQMLTIQTMNELYMDKPVFCKSCGALLYLPEHRELKQKGS